jgi:hypothetical protein
MATLLDISEALGYYEVIETQYPISTSRMAQIDARLTALAAVDAGLSSLVQDGMAEGVGDLRLNYGKHGAMLRQEGSRLLKDIANLSGITLRYNRFGGKSTVYSFNNDYG